jgi:2-polyprenyl-3-methyl-5-hydroxy-6-metoxy-1,4-benzoquinol methylase
MKLKARPENIIEQIALVFNLAPLPLLHTQVAFNAARAIMAAAETGVFDALGKTFKTPDEIARVCKTNAAATKQLLDCLTGIGYLNWKHSEYALKKKYYKWLLSEYPSNVIGKLRLQIIEWNWMSKMEHYIRTGESINFHSSLTASEWALYQKGMRDLSVTASKELARKFRIPVHASQMLDIGGAHGLYSIELCRKHPLLHSTILELPGAVEPARAIASENGASGRIQYLSGNALKDDFGDNCYDLVLINNLVHHFTNSENILLAEKAYRALKPGGLFAIGEFIRLKKPGAGGVVAATSSLYFAFTSSSGIWSLAEIKAWQQHAGLKLKKEISFISLPGFKVVVGEKK